MSVCFESSLRLNSLINKSTYFHREYFPRNTKPIHIICGPQQLDTFYVISCLGLPIWNGWRWRVLAMSLKARDAAYAVNPRSSPSLSYIISPVFIVSVSPAMYRESRTSYRPFTLGSVQDTHNMQYKYYMIALRTESGIAPDSTHSGHTQALQLWRIASI